MGVRLNPGVNARNAILARSDATAEVLYQSSALTIAAKIASAAIVSEVAEMRALVVMSSFPKRVRFQGIVLRKPAIVRYAASERPVRRDLGLLGNARSFSRAPAYEPYPEPALQSHGRENRAQAEAEKATRVQDD